MKFLIVFTAILATVYAQQAMQYAPMPYSFNYMAEGDEGTSGHQESGDGAGNVQGSYTLTDQDGRNRVVEYVADAQGYRATVRTNEPGTDNSAPADVVFESSSPDAKGPIIRYSNAEYPSRAQAYSPPAPSRAQAYNPPAPRRAQSYAPPARSQPQNVRYVLVPSTDPRASGRY